MTHSIIGPLAMPAASPAAEGGRLFRPACALDRRLPGFVRCGLVACALAFCPPAAADVPNFLAPYYVVDAPPYSRAMALLNLIGFGYPALVMADPVGCGVQVRASVFGPPEGYPIGTCAEIAALAAGRLDTDAYPDLVVTAGSAIVVMRGSASGALGPAVSYPVSWPTDVVAADVLGDYRAEVVVLRPDAGLIEVRVPDASGTLGPAMSFATGADPRSLSSADVIGDWRQDLIVPNYGDSTVSLFPGGAAGLGTRIDVPIGARPVAVAVADFDDDARADLMVSVATATQLLVFPGNGDGTFEAPLEVTAPFVAAVIRVGDTNGDGCRDLIIAPSSTGVSVLLGHGDLSFGPGMTFAELGHPTHLEVLDLDFDGRSDVLAGCPDSWNVAVLIAGPSGAFANHAKVAVGPGPGKLDVGDLNGDGVPDVAVANRGGTSVTLLMATGPGYFARTDLELGTTPSSLAIGDLDRTGPLDLVVALEHADGLAVFLGRDGDVPERLPDVATGRHPISVVIVDADDDGDGDLAVSALFDSRIESYPGNGDGTFGPRWAWPTPSWPYDLETGDFNGDGHPDLAVSEMLTYSWIEVLRGQGDGTYAIGTAVYLAEDPSSWAGFARLGDGIVDLVYLVPALCSPWECWPAPTLRVGQGNGIGGIVQTRSHKAGLGPTQATVGDLDGDGLDEVVVANAGGNSVSVFSDRPGPFGAPPGFGDKLQMGSWSPADVAIADVNRDGKPDILVSNSASNTVSILYNLETGVGVETRAPGPRLLLDRVRPNPTRGLVSMTLTLPRAGRAQVRVFDGAGRLVRALLDADVAAGVRALTWDGRSDRGGVVAPGVYYLDARSAGARATTRIVLLR